MSDSYIYEVEQLQAKSRLRDEQKDAEIERLRGLLREGLDHHDEYNWQQRVREALGE